MVPVLGAHSKVVVVGRGDVLTDVSARRAQELHCAGSSLFQPAVLDAPTGHSWPCQWSCWCFWETMFMKEQSSTQTVSSDEKKCEKQSCRHQYQRIRKRWRCFRYWSRESPATCGEKYAGTDIHAADHGGPHTRGGGYFLKGRPCSIHTGAGQKCEEEGIAERNCYGLTMNHPSPFPLCRSVWGRGTGNEGLMLIGKWSPCLHLRLQGGFILFSSLPTFPYKSSWVGRWQ